MDEKKRRKALTQSYKERSVTGGAYVITNTATGKQLLVCETDLQGSRNRFEFQQSVGSCPTMRLQKEWQQYGPGAFTFTVLEELEKKDTQTLREFQEELAVLEEVWREKLGPETLY